MHQLIINTTPYIYVGAVGALSAFAYGLAGAVAINVLAEVFS